jgi:diguanylate cyclase (GGDEF)-like protein
VIPSEAVPPIPTCVTRLRKYGYLPVRPILLRMTPNHHVATAPGARSATASVDGADHPFSPAEALGTIYRQADRWMAVFISAHLLFAVAIAPVYGTWNAVVLVGGGLALSFVLSAWRWPGSFWTRCVAGVALQGFAALHIYQMHGMAEMHFFIFTAVTMMIAYQDVVALWPGVVGIVAQHTVFAYWHNAGNPIGGVPFFEHHHAGTMQLGFHFGIAVVEVVIASFWTYALRQRTLRNAKQRVALADANAALAEREADTARSLALVEATLEATPDGILVLDAADRVTDYNKRVAEMWAIPPALLAEGDGTAVRNRLLAQVCDPAALSAHYAVTGNEPVYQRLDQVELTDGRVFECHVRPQHVGTNAVGRVLSFHDVTERVRLERELAHQALTDALTGLANRVLFRDRVAHALARSSRNPGSVAVLLVDLDGFKLINDGLGHGVGDAVLCRVAECFQHAVRDGDTVARLGGDEFAILLEDVRTVEEADAAAARLYGALTLPVTVGLRQPGVTESAEWKTDGSSDESGAGSAREVFVKASIGIALATPGEDPEALLRNADVAMYAAKARGKGQAMHFERSMHEQALTRLRLEEDLRVAVADLVQGGDSPFAVVFQPIVALDTQKVVSAEALVRWNHPRRGVISPEEFIPVAEDTGLIVPLGLWVLTQACAAAASWPISDDDNEIGVSVNLSGRQLQDASIVDDVRAVLASTGLAPRRLTLEITESVVLRDTSHTLDQLTALKTLGLRLAVDDFGTGYSSLSYLRQFPVDVLKIDKSFIDGIARGGDGAALARTIVALADTLQLRTVAEGIEDGAQHSALRALGCTLGQGFLFARPMTQGELLRCIAGSVSQHVQTGVRE